MAIRSRSYSKVLLSRRARSGRRRLDKSCAQSESPVTLPRNPPDTFFGLDNAVGRHENERLLFAFAGTCANYPDPVRLPAGSESYPPTHDAAHHNQIRIDRRAGSGITTEEQPICAAQGFNSFCKPVDVLNVGWHSGVREAGNIETDDAGDRPAPVPMLAAGTARDSRTVEKHRALGDEMPIGVCGYPCPPVGTELDAVDNHGSRVGPQTVRAGPSAAALWLADSGVLSRMRGRVAGSPPL